MRELGLREDRGGPHLVRSAGLRPRSGWALGEPPLCPRGRVTPRGQGGARARVGLHVGGRGHRDPEPPPLLLESKDFFRVFFINRMCLPRRGDDLWQLPNARNAYILLCVSQLLRIFLSKWALYEGSRVGPDLETSEVGIVMRKCNNYSTLLTRQCRVDSGRKFRFRELICNYCKICFKKQIHIFF